MGFLTRMALVFAVATAASAGDPPRQWVDAATGHRIVRLSDEPGSPHVYAVEVAHQ